MSEFNVNISLTTLQRRMKDLEYHIMVPKRKPLLSIVQRKRTVQWPRSMFLEIYSSGSQLFSAMRVSLWFPWITVEKYGEKRWIIQSWMHTKDGVVSIFSYGMGCVKFVEKTLKSDDYQQILKDGLLPTIEEQ